MFVANKHTASANNLSNCCCCCCCATEWMCVFVWPYVPARLCILPNKWKFAMAFDSGLGSVLVDFFAYFLFARLAFGFLPLRCVCECVYVERECGCLASYNCASIFWLLTDTARTIVVVVVVVAVFVPIVLLWSRCAHSTHTHTRTNKQFDYNNKCKFTRCFFLYKYDCFINVCHQLESNHRRVKTITIAFGSRRIKYIWFIFLYTTPICIENNYWKSSEIGFVVFFFLSKISFYVWFNSVFLLFVFFFGCVISTSAASTFE